ncbi:MAG: 6-phosphogluconolactonase [Acidobacteria bacterium]|nr:6-phosphogluconolactonase [Acidobacteriota bacterium]
MHHDVLVDADLDELARHGARVIAAHARDAVTARGRFTMAVSGGHNPWTMFRELTSCDVPWGQTQIFQVDERVAPRGDRDRNLTYLEDSLRGVDADIVAMPVEDDDLDAAAARYEQRLPARFDLIHLGLGPDGHTASLVAHDPVLEVNDRMVALTGPYQGRRRMTLTYRALARGEQLLWLITGEEARSALTLLLAGDATIPAGRVHAAHSLVMTDLTVA